MKYINKIVLMLTIGLLLASCGSEQKYVKNPIDTIVRDLNSVRDYSIILYDMDYDESLDSYKHQYQLVLPQGDSLDVKSKITPWHEVSDEVFDQHANNMGMEIASKKDGILKKAVAPAGYSNYVGNKQYGSWQQSNGSSFWVFYGQYAMMRSIFGGSYYHSYGYYNDYNRNYRGYGRSYYGPSSGGRTAYGTSSKYNANKSKNRTWSKKPSSFKNRVRGKVKQSAVRSKQARTSRNSSRYSSSSSRSRSGGFGK